MTGYDNGASFEHLRRFADQLDFRFGVTDRKHILAGNERLTLTTDEHGWTQWLEGVQNRLARVNGLEPDRELATQLVRLKILTNPNASEHNTD